MPHDPHKPSGKQEHGQACGLPGQGATLGYVRFDSAVLNRFPFLRQAKDLGHDYRKMVNKSDQFNIRDETEEDGAEHQDGLEESAEVA